MMATSDRLTTEATSVPAMAQAASVLSAPKRRNQRNPYTVATAFPTGSELVSACDPNVNFSSVHHGGRRWPATRSSHCMMAKATYEAISTAKASGTQPHLSVWKTSANPDSSRPLRRQHPDGDRHQGEADQDADGRPGPPQSPPPRRLPGHGHRARLVDLRRARLRRARRRSGRLPHGRHRSAARRRHAGLRAHRAGLGIRAATRARRR